jgi:alpha-amylase
VPDIALYFQAHQPTRLRWYTAFDAGGDWFDRERDLAILQRVATRCYRPALGLLLDLAARHRGDLCFSISISGTLLEQWREACPDLIHLVKELVGTGCCEPLAETSHHSLASLAESGEFEAQVRAQMETLGSLFGVRPRVFRNTELIYSDRIAGRVSMIRGDRGEAMFDGILAEGADRLLAGRPAGGIYRSAPPTESVQAGAEPLPVLLRDHRLSDEIAFRFEADAHAGRRHPLTARDFARFASERIARDAEPTSGVGPRVHLIGMDLETFGEHLPSALGVFDFLEGLPGAILREPGACGPMRFVTPSQAIEARASASPGDAEVWRVETPASWADESRDVSAWLGNPMQREAFAAHAQVAHELELASRAGIASGDAPTNQELSALVESARRLSTSDHWYWMSTKPGSDGRVHDYFRAYASPYDAFVNYANVLADVRRRARELQASRPRVPSA